ncbi:MAG TPA: flagellin lysine-N-methylase [Terracidiphilus sp.]|nr:flagellin lysine-N-methylase [Terracidiphilus sp.]
MNSTDSVSPQYAHRFQCIGSACEDTCCQGWQVPIDEATYQRYQNLPEGPLRTSIVENLQRKPVEEAAKNPAVFAIIHMTAENRCPMLTADRLCNIQSQYGHEFLSYTCATYPRIHHTSSGSAITALTLSCPEAARLVLLTPDLLAGNASPARIGEPTQQPPHISPALLACADAIRASVLSIATNRLYPLWQRLFLLSIFAKRLDGIVTGESDRTPADFLADFNATAMNGSLRIAMDALPADDLAQMDTVLRLAGLMLHRSNIGPRFQECINAFTNGIGNAPDATVASLAAHSRSAQARYFAPFFQRHPHILENYLVNTVLRLNFPFGSAKNPDEKDRTISQRFSVLAAQFALIRGLLIGIAGHHRERFSAEHIVHTVQSASKHFEHHPEFAREILALLAERNLDNSTGLTTLLREPAPAADTYGPSPLRTASAPRSNAIRPAS